MKKSAFGQWRRPKRLLTVWADGEFEIHVAQRIVAVDTAAVEVGLLLLGGNVERLLLAFGRIQDSLKLDLLGRSKRHRVISMHFYITMYCLLDISNDIRKLLGRLGSLCAGEVYNARLILVQQGHLCVEVLDGAPELFGNGGCRYVIDPALDSDFQRVKVTQNRLLIVLDGRWFGFSTHHVAQTEVSMSSASQNSILRRLSDTDFDDRLGSDLDCLGR